MHFSRGIKAIRELGNWDATQKSIGVWVVTGTFCCIHTFDTTEQQKEWNIDIYEVETWMEVSMVRERASQIDSTAWCHFLIFQKIFIVIQLQLYAFSLHPSTPPQLNSPPSPTSTVHPWFCPCVLYSSSCNPLSSLSPPHSPLSIARLFSFL